LSKLLICSESTKDFLSDFDEVRVVKGAPDVSILSEVGSYEKVTAIGGGAVVDTAKILSSKPIVCYPTTASGATETSWSVYWDGTDKKSLKRQKPKEVIIDSEFLNLPEKVIRDTTCDVVSHFLDSMFSKKKTEVSEEYCIEGLNLLRRKGSIVDLIRAGRLGGKAIEITGTNLLHSLSYPLTGIYEISHGEALGYFLPKISKFMGVDVSDITEEVSLNDIDIDLVVEEALKYDKINECSIFIDRKTLQEVLL
jgi:alcohol dehydrogenase class IV|tara:strand:- start:656 stop:1414 length:759 start_codon:yes stop_codon:yes gene_type:complete